MAHHKRKRPKHQRAGCLMCKPWKDERLGKKRTGKESGPPVSAQRKLQPDGD